ncbi:MAG: hypothetical protein CSA34_07960 [Desulfobulbus propionicus]|nr:MAG: hypothetical protein CSA34_07960 [Desulfobulbus propionicus]
MITEQDFFFEQQQLDRRWRSAFVLAGLLHVLVFTAAIYLPSLIDRKPILDEIVTVDLVSMPTPVEVAPPANPQPPPPPEPEPPVVEPSPPPEPQEAVAVAEPVAAPEPVVEAKPISIKPRKRKIKRAQDTRLAEEKEREQRRLEKEQQKRDVEKLKAKMRREAALAEAEAEAKRQQRLADEELRKRRKELAAMRQTVTPSGQSGSKGRKQVEELALQQYLASLHQRVRSFWVLPEMRAWDNQLKAVVVLRLGPDGNLLGMQMEQRSGDRYFDEFVEKTIALATPMPPFPRLLRRSSLEVGLVFRPGELSM